MGRLGHRTPHQGRRAEDAVEARVVDHLEDRPEPTSLLADEPGDGTVERDLGRGVRAVAELVLQPLDPEARLRPLEQEAREPGRRLREHEERVAHGRGAEPLVPVQLPHVAGRPGRRLVRAHVGAALALGHRHPAERLAGGQPRDPLLGEVGLRTERGDGGERHRERAADARLDLAEQHEQRCPRDVRARLRLDPRERLQARVQAEPEQRVPGGMELDLVDPLAVAVVCPQLRRILICEPAPFERLAAERLAERGDLRLPGRAAFPAESLDESRVLFVEVVAGERRRLVARRCALRRRHPCHCGPRDRDPLHRARQPGQAPVGARRDGFQGRSTQTGAPGSSWTSPS